jgi:maltose O-acetyltransferase
MDPRLKFSIANAIQASSLVPVNLRMRLLRLYGLRCELGARVFENTFFGSSKVRLGENCFISVRCLFDGSDFIDIGSHTHLAMSVQILTSSHEIGSAERRAGQGFSAPVTIGNGCWLGAGVIVQPGVVIADGCIIAPGGVVTKSIESNGIYAGVPVKRIRDLS